MTWLPAKRLALVQFEILFHLHPRNDVRVGSPGYIDVILRRIMNLTADTPVLAETGEMFAAVAEAHGVAIDRN